MANTIGWGKATQNNDNGFGKYQNTIGAASIYAESYAGETALVGTSAAFSYSASSYNQGEADPTPTITGTTGGTFSSDAGVSFIDTSTGQIDLSASTIATHAITYIIDGVQSTQNVGITAAPYSSTRSFSFDGVDSYFDAGYGISQSFSELSISTWINAASTASGAYDTIIRRGTWSAGAFELRNNASYAGLKFAIYPGTANVTTTGVTLNDGNWHHILVTYDGTNVKIYVDGSLNNSSTNGTGATGTSTQITTIGASEQGTSRYYEGKIDEVSIWDSALSSSAITEIYNSGAPNDLESLTNASSTNLVAWYKMGE